MIFVPFCIALERALSSLLFQYMRNHILISPPFSLISHITLQRFLISQDSSIDSLLKFMITITTTDATSRLRLSLRIIAEHLRAAPILSRRHSCILGINGLSSTAFLAQGPRSRSRSFWPARLSLGSVSTTTSVYSRFSAMQVKASGKSLKKFSLIKRESFWC